MTNTFPISGLALLLAACSTPAPPQQAAAPEVSALCDSYGFQRGTAPYQQCAEEVDKAMWRQARSARDRVNCTPMGNQTVCQ